DLARRAVQQPRSQPFLELLHMLADHAGGNAEPSRSAGEAAAIHHVCEDPHIVEAIHRAFLIIKQSRIVYSSIVILSNAVQAVESIVQPGSGDRSQYLAIGRGPCFRSVPTREMGSSAH